MSHPASYSSRRHDRSATKWQLRISPLFLFLFCDIVVGLRWNSGSQLHPTGVRHTSPNAMGKGSRALRMLLEDVRDKTQSVVMGEIRELMAKHDPILLFASRLLPPTTAQDASALYAWCRRLDEITDDPTADAATVQERLQDWEQRFDKLCNEKPVDAMDAALAECLERNSKSLGRAPFDDMVSGMKADAVPNRRVSNMEELEEYAYQVAGTVGLMLLPLLNADMERARAPAIALGKAIQLINILRDAAPDAALGRVYLPQDMLVAQGVLSEDVLRLKSSAAYCKVVATVANRAKELLKQAESGRSTLPGLGPLFVQIIIELYREYLEKLQGMDYNNLGASGERVRISTLQKIGASVKAVATIVTQGSAN